jgi:hypothetical protein
MKIEIDRSLGSKEFKCFFVNFLIFFSIFSIFFFKVWGYDIKRTFIENRDYERFVTTKVIHNDNGYVYTSTYEDGSSNRSEHNFEVVEGGHYTTKERYGKFELVFFFIIHIILSGLVGLIFMFMNQGLFVYYWEGKQTNIVKGSIQ